MAKILATAENTDTSPVNGDEFQNSGESTVFHWVNGFDVEATFTVEGSYGGDSDFSDAVELGSTTVAAGETDRDGLTEEWDILRVVISFTGDPSSGQAVAYKHEER